jgi:hypothetical protein
MASPPSELTNLLTGLAAAGVDFVLVGALAAVAQGAPLTTHDVDIVRCRTPENVERLLRFLGSVHARYRGRPAGHALPPSRDALLTKGRSLFATDLGPLDVLGAIEGGRGSDDLIGASLEIEAGGQRIRVLGLSTLVELKRGSTHPKDRNTWRSWRRPSGASTADGAPPSVERRPAARTARRSEPVPAPVPDPASPTPVEHPPTQVRAGHGLGRAHGFAGASDGQGVV